MPYRSIKIIIQTIALIGVFGFYSPSQGMEKEEEEEENENLPRFYSPSKVMEEENNNVNEVPPSLNPPRPFDFNPFYDANVEHSLQRDDRVVLGDYSQAKEMEGDSSDAFDRDGLPRFQAQGMEEENSADSSSSSLNSHKLLKTYVYDGETGKFLQHKDRDPSEGFFQAQGMKKEPHNTHAFHKIYDGETGRFIRLDSGQPLSGPDARRKTTMLPPPKRRVIEQTDSSPFNFPELPGEVKEHLFHFFSGEKRSRVLYSVSKECQLLINITTRKLVIGNSHNPKKIQENEESIVNFFKKFKKNIFLPHLTSLNSLLEEIAVNPQIIPKENIFLPPLTSLISLFREMAADPYKIILKKDTFLPHLMSLTSLFKEVRDPRAGADPENNEEICDIKMDSRAGGNDKVRVFRAVLKKNIFLSHLTSLTSFLEKMSADPYEVILKENTFLPHLTSLIFLSGEMAADPFRIIEAISSIPPMYNIPQVVAKDSQINFEIPQLRKIVFSESFPRLNVIGNPKIDFYIALCLLTKLKNLTHLELPSGQTISFLFNSVLKPLAPKLEVLVFHEHSNNMSNWGEKGRISTPIFSALTKLKFSLCGGETRYVRFLTSLAEGTTTLEEIEIACVSPGKKAFRIDYLVKPLQNLFSKNSGLKHLALLRLALPPKNLFPDSIQSLDLRQSTCAYSHNDKRLPHLQELRISFYKRDMNIQNTFRGSALQNLTKLIIDIPSKYDLRQLDYQLLINLKKLVFIFDEESNGLKFNLGVKKFLGLKGLEHLTFKINQIETAETILQKEKSIFRSIPMLERFNIKISKTTKRKTEDCTSLFKRINTIECVVFNFPQKYLLTISVDRPPSKDPDNPNKPVFSPYLSPQ